MVLRDRDVFPSHTYFTAGTACGRTKRVPLGHPCEGRRRRGAGLRMTLSLSGPGRSVGRLFSGQVGAKRADRSRRACRYRGLPCDRRLAGGRVRRHREPAHGGARASIIRTGREYRCPEAGEARSRARTEKDRGESGARTRARPPLLPSQTPRPRKPRPLTKQPRRSHASWTGTPSRSRRRSAGSPT